jgi:hypothetical protein
VVARVHTAEAALASTAKDAEQDFFGLIISIMAQGKLVCPLFGHYLIKTLIAECTCCHLQGATMFFLPVVNFHLLLHNWQAELVAEILDKKGVLICFSTTESVMDMSHHQLHFEAVLESVEEMAESDRIRATGYGDHNQIA